MPDGVELIIPKTFGCSFLLSSAREGIYHPWSTSLSEWERVDVLLAISQALSSRACSRGIGYTNSRTPGIDESVTSICESPIPPPSPSAYAAKFCGLCRGDISIDRGQYRRQQVMNNKI